MARDKSRETVLNFDSVLRIETHICVPKMGDLIILILEELIVLDILPIKGLRRCIMI